MPRVAATAIIGLCALLLAALIAVIFDPLESTEALDANIANVTQQVKKATEESDRYIGGLLKTLIEIRVQTLKQTEAMLQQKRASILRGLKLSYLISGVPYEPATEAQLAAIAKDIERADQKLSESKQKASQYSGGLLQSMALIAVETDQAAISQLWLKYYSAKYGLPTLAPNTGEAKQLGPPGTVVEDKEAL